MKNVCFIFLLFAFGGCKNRDTAPEERKLAGTWEWIESQGGKTGLTIKASTATNRQLIFTREGGFEMIENGQSKIKTDYVIKEGNSITSTELIPLIYYRSNYWQQSYSIRGDSLFLTDEVYDGHRHIYIRIR